MNEPKTDIRLIRITDADPLSTHLVRDAAAFARWEPARPAEFATPDGQRRRIEQLLEEHDQGARFPAVIVADGIVIGQVTVSSILGPPFRKGSLGYWVATTHHGRGHATRAVGLALQLMAGQLDLHRAEAHTQIDNLASQEVLRRNGFASFGIAHDHIYIQDAWRDEIFWERSLSG